MAATEAFTNGHPPCTPALKREAIRQVVERGCKVVDVATDALVIETTGDTPKIQAFLRVLEPYGIKEIAQSGLLAIGRGSKSITERVFKN